MEEMKKGWEKEKEDLLKRMASLEMKLAGYEDREREGGKGIRGGGRE